MGVEEGGAVDKKITIGVCVMEKKVKCGPEVFSAPMEQIMDRIHAFGEFEIIHSGDKVILEDPVESWSICDCLIAFHSSGYPLEKVQAYSSLRKPFLVNELDPQYLLHDRRKVYEHLEMYGIPVPRYACVNRKVPDEDLDYFVEEEDFVEVNGERFWKPFVEKPVNGDDHSIMIYYPSSAGGGMKELFRKVGNRSSEFHPDVRRVRREGSYIYEEFMPTGGTDVKVYTVGPEYAHAEARKPPVVDGVVMRNPDGKEVRYPVLLTPAEKQMAREVCIAFRQAVCGFDLLRSEGSSYVCDVNGWSFVKNSYKNVLRRCCFCDTSVIKPGLGAKRVEKLITYLLSSENFRPRQCRYTHVTKGITTMLLVCYGKCFWIYLGFDEHGGSKSVDWKRNQTSLTRRCEAKFVK